MTSEDTTGKRAVIYARISKDRAGAGLGVGKQADDCRDLAARLGFTVIEPVREDNDLTAFKGTRRSKPRNGYRALLGDIRDGRADVVLAWHTDRLHRDMAELEEYITVCGEGRSGIPTYTVQGGDLDLSTASGRMVARILGAVARQEVEHMIERQKSAKERIRNAGGWNGGPRPFGFRADGPSTKNGGDGSLAQVPAEAEAIRYAYGYVLANAGRKDIGLNTIAREWNARGLATPKESARGGGHRWHHSTIRNLLTRARNAGLIEYHGEIIGKGNWEPIVSEDTWRSVRAVLAYPERRTTPGPQPRWLLTGVLDCGVCNGTTFRVVRTGRDKRPSYVCATYTLRDDGEMKISGCVGRDAERLDEYAEWLIIEKLRRPDMAPALTTPGVDIAALDGRRAALRALLNEFAATPGITPRQLQIASEPLLAETGDIDGAISKALQGTGLEDFAGDDDPEKIWHDLDIDRRRAVAATLLRVVILPARGRKKPAGWRPGMPHPFDDTAIRVTSPDGQPWGTPDPS